MGKKRNIQPPKKCSGRRNTPKMNQVGPAANPHARSAERPRWEFPSVFTNPATKETYTIIRNLGKGGFATCFVVKESKTKELFACKISVKPDLIERYTRSGSGDHTGAMKILGKEIALQKGCSSKRIVALYSYFEDETFVYIIMELCDGGSLLDLVARRGRLTEPEAKYFLKQILEAIEYLHEDRSIVHRDLKIGNIFIKDDGNIRVGDLGLAELLSDRGSRLYCGTPNYIAPEIVDRVSYSFPVDIWALGVVFYTMLMGNPPFEMETRQLTEAKIKAGKYDMGDIPKNSPCIRFLNTLLQQDPSQRPTATQALQSDYFTEMFTPLYLSPNYLTGAPTTDYTGAQTVCITEGEVDSLDTKNVLTHMKNLQMTLYNLCATALPSRNNNIKVPQELNIDYCGTWIMSWAEYYGAFAYYLSSGNVGITFGDGTKLLQFPEEDVIVYMANGLKYYCRSDLYPQDIRDKVKLFNESKVFLRRFIEHSEKRTSIPQIRNAIRNINTYVPYVWNWFLTSNNAMLLLTDGKFQINDRKSNTEHIFCAVTNSYTVIQRDSMTTSSFHVMHNDGLTSEQRKWVQYARDRLRDFLILPVTREVTVSEALSQLSIAGSVE